MVKVKIHRKLESATDIFDLWLIAGNMSADSAVTMAYLAIPPDIRLLADQIVAHIEREASMLSGYFNFWTAFNKRRCQILDEKKQTDTQSYLIRPRVAHAHARSDGLFIGH